MNRFIRQQLAKIKQGKERLNQFKKRWPLFLLIAVVVWGYVGVRGTGFLAGHWGIIDDGIAEVTIEKNDKGNEDTSIAKLVIRHPNKTIWDVLQLLGVPFVLAILGAWFQKSQQEQADRTARTLQEQADRTARALQEQADQTTRVLQEQAERVAREQREKDANEAREEVLQLYFDRISALLVDQNLMSIANQGRDAVPAKRELLESARDIIRARTLSILRRFEEDIGRKSSVIRFLAEAEIVGKFKLNLTGANLSKSNLNESNLTGANLNRANLNRANLYKANLNRANLYKAGLYEANLIGANLVRSCLLGASLIDANLDNANLNSADLTGAYLNNAYLNSAYLNKSSLNDANLEGANLQGAYLIGANLKRTYLKGASLEGANLKGAYLGSTIFIGASLEGANLEGIQFNDDTTWPAKEEVAKAKNIPTELQKQLGLIPELPPQNQPTDQPSPQESQ